MMYVFVYFVYLYFCICVSISAKFGANAILGISLAVCKAGAKQKVIYFRICRGTYVAHYLRQNESKHDRLSYLPLHRVLFGLSRKALPAVVPQSELSVVSYLCIRY